MSIPKKPLAVSRAKKKLPVELDWGPGVPKDRLAYINADEKALIQRFRKTKAAREYAGVPAFASDSASSKGVERGADGPSGVGRGSGSGGSSTSGSSSGSKSTSSSSSTSGGGNKSASGTSTSWGGASSASKAASSASTRASSPSASPSSGNKSTSGTSTSWGGPATNAGASGSVSRPSVSTSKAPNAAASYASSKLNATANALKSAQQPQSIQGMINANTGRYPSRGDTPGTSPTDRYNTPNWGTDIAAVYRREVQDVGKPNAYVDNSAQRLHDWSIDKLSQYTGRTPKEVSEMARTTYGEAANQGPLGMAAVSNVMENRLKLGAYSPDQYGYLGAGAVSPMLKGFDANGYDYGVRNGVPQGGNAAYRNATIGTEGMTGGLQGMTDALDRYSDFSMTAPDVVKNATHYYNPSDARPSWGKGFTAYGDHVFGNAERTASRVANLRDSGGLASVGLAASSITSEPAAPRPQAIPSPISEGMLNTKMAQSRVVTDPRVSMPPGNLAPPETGSPPGYMSQFAMNEQDMANLKTQAMKDFSFGDLMKMQQNQSALPGFMGPITKDAQRVAQAPAPVQQAAAVPQGPLPSALPGFKPPGLPGNFRGTAGQAYTYNSPSNWSPQVAAGDAVPEDGPVYSDNPMQGPVNPMQEGVQVEDPGVTKQRQQKYAGRGAAIGSAIAGPLGAVVGGTLGWQMGKTSPQQRQAIASNPKAVQANVQSINQMVEERGGKGNPQMQVTESGFRDVLTNPQKVTQNPGNYTTLEQMLAALAQGIDPKTGKPIV